MRRHKVRPLSSPRYDRSLADKRQKIEAWFKSNRELVFTATLLVVGPPPDGVRYYSMSWESWKWRERAWAAMFEQLPAILQLHGHFSLGLSPDPKSDSFAADLTEQFAQWCALHTCKENES